MQALLIATAILCVDFLITWGIFHLIGLCIEAAAGLGGVEFIVTGTMSCIVAVAYKLFKLL